MSHIDAGPLSTYNSLMDKHLAGYFSNSKMRRHLKKSGLITRRGEIVSQNQFRHNMAKKEHKSHVKDLLAQAIVHKTLDMERMRQVAIKKKLEEIAKIELVRRVKTDRQRQGDEDVLPYLSPRPNSASQRPKTSPARGRPRDPYQRPDARLGFQEHPDGSARQPVYIDAEGKPISPRDEKYPKEEIDTRHLYGLDNVALREYTMTLDESKKGKGGSSPYVQSQLPDDSKIPSPPRTSRSVQSAGSKRRLRPMKHRGALHRQEPPMTHPSRLQSLCQVTIRYHGDNLFLAHEILGDPRHEILVEQQHCGGNTLIVYKDLLMPGTDFTFLSRRHRGYPFSLSFYLNGVMSARLSTCCEFKHTIGCKIGGKQGHFGLVSVTDGLGPCYKCQVEKQVKDSEKKKKKPKAVKEEKAEADEEAEEEDYEDDFDDDDDDKSSKRDDDKDGGAGGASGKGGDSSSDAGDSDDVPEEPEDEKKDDDKGKGKAAGGENDKDDGVVSSDSEAEEANDKVVVAADVHASDKEKVESVAESESEVEEEKKDVSIIVTSASPGTTPEEVASPAASEPASAPASEVASPRESTPTSAPESPVASPREASPEPVSSPKEETPVTSPQDSPPATPKETEDEKEAEDESGAESDVSDDSADADADAEPDYTSTSDTESRTGTGSESDVGAYLALKSTPPTLEPVVEHEGSISTMIENKQHVDLSSIQLNKTQVNELCADVAERNDIQSVVVRNGKLDDKSIRKLTDSILQTPSEVKMLNFNLNRITPEGAKHVASIIKQRPKIQVLLLHGNPLGDAGVKEIVDAVEYLKIAAEPKPMSPTSDSGSVASARSTESEEGTPIRTAAKDLVKGVMDDVMRSPSFQELRPGQTFHLLQVDLGDTTMGDVGAAEVARLITFNTPLSTLNLTGNMNIKRAGWESIAAALKNNTNLKVLTLDYTMLGDAGIEIIADGLKHNNTLRTLDLEGNFITDKGGEAIVNLLSENKSICGITIMPGNNMSEDVQSQIKAVLEERKS